MFIFFFPFLDDTTECQEKYALLFDKEVIHCVLFYTPISSSS